MLDQIGYWILVALGFGSLIFVHELGHFIAARFVGIRVIRFALGFGPRLFGTNRFADHKDPERRRPGTDYCICLIPCGGYVKMAGGEGEAGAETSGAPDEFPSKTPGQRALVVAAGPAMSVLAALPLMFILLFVGLERPSARISHVEPGTGAWKAGLKHGDRITGLRLRGEEEWKEIKLWRELEFNAKLQDKVGRIEVRFVRDGEPMKADVKTDREGRIGVGAAIVGRQRGYRTTVVGHVKKGGAADEAGITPGATMLEIDGRNVYAWEVVEDAVARNPRKALPVKFQTPDGQVRRTTLTVRSKTYRAPAILASRRAVVGKDMVRSGFPADGVLKAGDRIVAFNGYKVANWPELAAAVIDHRKPGENEISLVRDDEPMTVSLALGEGDEIGDVLGIAPEPFPVAEAPPAGKEPLVPVGTKLLAMGDAGSQRKPESLRHIDEVQFLDWRDDNTETLYVRWKRGEREVDVAVPLVERELGVMDFSPRLDRTYVIEPGQPVASLGQAFVETWGWMTFAVKGPWLLVTGKLSFKDEVGGPLLILTATRYQAEAGFSMFVEFLVIITIHLGIINLVPFPVLDGGHLAFLAVEKVLRRPCPEKLMAGLMYGGMVAIIALMLFVTWNDIMKLTGLFGR